MRLKDRIHAFAQLGVVLNTISKKGQMERSDLSKPPFDRIQPYHKLFEEEDVEDIMIICNTLEKRFNANK